MAPNTSAGKPAAAAAFDPDKAISDAARELSLSERIDYSRAKDMVLGTPDKYLSRDTCQRIRHSREQVAANRERFKASYLALKKWAVENGLGDNLSEMIVEIERTTGGGSKFTRTHEEQQASLDASDAKHEAAYKAGQAEHARIRAARSAPVV